MRRTLTRRQALGTIGGLGAAVVLAACGQDDSTSASSTASGATSAATGSTGSDVDASSCSAIPAETAGPYPGDGSNGPNARTLDGIVRSDIRTSVGSEDAVDGVACALELVVLDASTCAPKPGVAVYAWHCDAVGRYSLYSDGVTEETFLRGIQVADDDGVVRFESIVAGCYPGRWPHVHFEVYESVADATGSGSPIATSQLAFPQSDCEAVFADDRYGSSASNLGQLSLATDMVFSDDGAVHQLATMSGDVAAGYVARLEVPV